MTQEHANGQPFHQGAKFPSPVVKVLALGWRDGPTDGVMECQPGSPVFKFDLLGEIRQWPTEEQDLRIFSLAPLPPTALQELTAAYARYFQPCWPVWAPVWMFPTAADQNAMESLTDEVLQQAGPPAWVIATSDLAGEILACRPVTAEDVERTADWPSFLGLGKSPSLHG